MSRSPHIVADLAHGYSEPMGQEPLTTRRWKRAEYARLVDLGAFVSDPTLTPPAVVVPLGVTGVQIAVADLLP